MRWSTRTIGALALCTATVAVAAVAQERDPETACLAPRPLKDTLECVQSVAKYSGRLELIKEDPAGARVMRMHTGKGNDIFLLESIGAEKWSAHPIAYEQVHGKRASRFELVGLSKVAVGARSVWRVDYKIDAETVARREERRGVQERTALCSPTSPQGCVNVVTSCVVTRTVDDESKTEQFKGTLVIEPDGKVLVRSEQRIVGTVCRPAAPQALWPGTVPLIPDRPHVPIRVPTPPPPDVPR
jgi:hypothetical protein